MDNHKIDRLREPFPAQSSNAATFTRRQVIAGVAVALGGALAVSQLSGQTPQPMEEKPSTGAEGKLTFLHQEVELMATPARVYDVLLDAKQFAACTGMPAQISALEGGAFSTFGGLIVGRNIELVPAQRIVQVWRPANWDPGIYSLVKFELKPKGGATLMVLDHTGFPEGNFGHLNSGWPLRYWEPLKKYLASA